MRKLCMSLLLMGVTSLGFAQYASKDIGNLESSLGFAFANPDYLDEVQGDISPNYAKFLEGIVAGWDVTEAQGFDHRDELFKVTFKSKKGYIHVVFDSKGKIQYAHEKFKNVALPWHIVQTIARENPSWIAVNSTYSVNYSKDKSTTKLLKIRLEKDGQTRTLKLTDSGNLL